MLCVVLFLNALSPPHVRGQLPVDINTVTPPSASAELSVFVSAAFFATAFLQIPTYFASTEFLYERYIRR